MRHMANEASSDGFAHRDERHEKRLCETNKRNRPDHRNMEHSTRKI